MGVNRNHLSLAALAVVLVALGIALMPFAVNPTTSCSPAAVSALQTRSVRAWSDPLSTGYQPLFTPPTAGSSTFDPVTHEWSSVASLAPTQPVMVSVPTACAKKARPRLESSGVLLALTTIGWLVGRRIIPGGGPGACPRVGTEGCAQGSKAVQ
jgi:hypothetical protein